MTAGSKNHWRSEEDWQLIRRRLLMCAALLVLPAIGGCEMKVVGETAQDYFGKTAEAALARAAAEGRVDEVKRLIKEGAKVNAAGKKMMTPLIWALIARNPQGMRALLESGADPNQRMGFDKGANVDFYKGFHPVWLAAGQKNPDQLKVLLEFKGDPNARFKGASYVPLMTALMDIDQTGFENIKLLVEAGADINVADELGSSFVLSAADIEQYDVVVYALQHGYNRNLPLLAWQLNAVKPNHRMLHPDRDPQRLQALDILKQHGVTPPPGKAPPLQPDKLLDSVAPKSTTPSAK